MKERQTAELSLPVQLMLDQQNISMLTPMDTTKMMS
jgi:hypothetical protein